MGDPPEDWRQYLGRKVSVRYRVHGDARHSATEAVGVVMSVGPDETGAIRIEVLSRSGAVKRFGAADVMAAKIFP